LTFGAPIATACTGSPAGKSPARARLSSLKKGANVIFGKDSHVTIRGGLRVEDGAHVSFLGKLKLIEKSDDAVIEQARKRLGG